MYVFPVSPITPTNHRLTAAECSAWFQSVRPAASYPDDEQRSVPAPARTRPRCRRPRPTPLPVSQARSWATPRLAPTSFPSYAPMAIAHAPSHVDRWPVAASRLVAFPERPPTPNTLLDEILSPRTPVTCLPLHPPATTTARRRHHQLLPCHSAVVLGGDTRGQRRPSYWVPTRPGTDRAIRKAAPSARIGRASRRLASPPPTPGPGAFTVEYDAVLPRAPAPILPLNEAPPQTSKRPIRATSAAVLPLAERVKRDRARSADAQRRRRALESARRARLDDAQGASGREEPGDGRSRRWLAVTAAILAAHALTDGARSVRTPRLRFRDAAIIVTRLQCWVLRSQASARGMAIEELDREQFSQRRRAVVREHRVAALKCLVDLFDNATLRATFFRSIHRVLDSVTVLQRWWRRVRLVRRARLDFIRRLIRAAITCRRLRVRRSRRCALLENIIVSQMVDTVYVEAQRAFRDVNKRRMAGIAIEIAPDTGLLRRECWFRMPLLHRRGQWRARIVAALKTARPRKGARQVAVARTRRRGER